MKSGLSSGNPHRLDAGDGEPRKVSVCRLVVTGSAAALIEKRLNNARVEVEVKTAT